VAALKVSLDGLTGHLAFLKTPPLPSIDKMFVFISRRGEVVSLSFSLCACFLSRFLSPLLLLYHVVVIRLRWSVVYMRWSVCVRIVYMRASCCPHNPIDQAAAAEIL
jgi:Na+/H+ antiporter NhaB